MASFPALNQEDIEVIDSTLRDLLKKSEAHVALLVEKAGYLIHQCGNPSDELDTTTFATLGSNAYNAVQFMASLVNENNFTSMYQQGENFSTLMVNVDENSLLVIVFPTHLTVGSMKYYAGPAVRAICDRIIVSSTRGDVVDFSDIDARDVQALFTQKPAET
jgi:predicted regulator of Ras-like GTPase activity (Roadblock/LC7/MglB family)